ncbi:MAG TPA: hypothetical protein VIS96_12100 [Terrimicrobiaceae bacterium]
MLIQYAGWTQANGDSFAQLTAITGAPGNLWPYPVSALPAAIAQGMPNILQCYISGYATPQAVAGRVNAIGELLVTRQYEGVVESGKAYVYLVAIDDEMRPWFRGPFKPYGPRYFNQAQPIPSGELFGKIQHGNLNKTKL